MSAYIHLTDIMHPATLHGVGVITKLYFAIFVAFKESMTLNLAQRSSKVIHFGGNRKPVYDFIYAAQRSSEVMDFGTNRKPVYIILLVVNSSLDPILHHFRDTAV